MNYLSKYFTSKAIGVFFVLILLVLAFLQNYLPFHWLILSVITTLLFFSFSNILSIKWLAIPESQFRKRLFFWALVIRVVWVLVSYQLFLKMTGEPYEFFAADSIGYNDEATWIVYLIKSGNFSKYLDYIATKYSDMGYPLFLGLQYYVTNSSIIIARIIKSILGAFTCLMVYRIATRNFSEEVGRIAGILAMLLPNLIFYCGLHTKEAEMVFLTVAFLYQADKLFYSKRLNIFKVFITVVLGLSLFFFRTVLGAAAFFALFTAVIFSSTRQVGIPHRIFTAFWFVILFVLLSGSLVTSEVSKIWEARESNQEIQMKNFSTRSSGNQFAKYGSSALFAPIIVIAPFPTLVNIEGQDNIMMLAGAYYTRNIYGFFILIALFWLVRQGRYKNHLLILSFTGGYLAVLTLSGFALSERFHLPVLPFLVILAAHGISLLKEKHKNYFNAYLVIIIVFVIGWNWFKLAGRGLI